MASLSFYLAAAVLLAQSSVAFNCSIPAIYVDIHKRVTHNTDNFQYGSFIGVGTPAQNHSLWPSLSRNQTSFGAGTFCDGNSTLEDCRRSTGGFFNSRDSTTYVYTTHHKLPHAYVGSASLRTSNTRRWTLHPTAPLRSPSTDMTRSACTHITSRQTARGRLLWTIHLCKWWKKVQRNPVSLVLEHHPLS